MKKLIAGIWLGLLLLLPIAGLHGAEPGRRPNVVFVLADDLGYGDLGCYGQKLIRTPHLDELARQGMRFTHHYAGSPVCAPSRCVLLTGRHPGHAWVRDNVEVGTWYSFQGQMPLPAGTTTLAGALHGAGYATAAFGKWGLGGVGSSGDPLRQGFDHFFGFNDQRQAHNYYPQYLNDDASRWPLPGNAAVTENEGVALPAGADPRAPARYAAFQGTQYAPDLCPEQALAFLRAHTNQPFLLYYPTTVPHLALQVPADSLAEYSGQLADQPYPGGKGYLPHPSPHAAYAAMITRMDRDVGRLLAAVRELGLADNTIFVFTSDNGAVFPLAGVDPEFFHSTGGLRGYKQDVYEGGLRVPLIVAWPGRIPAGMTESRVTGFEDWFPTLLDLTGAPPPPGVELDGVSFAPTLLGRPQPARPFLYREFHGVGGQVAVREGDWKLVRRHLLPAPARPAEMPTTELYDLAADPAEARNLAADRPEVVARLSAIIRAQHRTSAAFPLPALDSSAGR